MDRNQLYRTKYIFPYMIMNLKHHHITISLAMVLTISFAWKNTAHNNATAQVHKQLHERMLPFSSQLIGLLINAFLVVLREKGATDVRIQPLGNKV